MRERLERWLDRRFFRDAAERDRLLVDLVHELARRDDLHGLDTLVIGRIDKALHPQEVQLLFVRRPSVPGGRRCDVGRVARRRVAVPVRGGDGVCGSADPRGEEIGGALFA